MRGYIVPKYLQKRKIELLRQKIICRKFGYMFFRKTVSRILPSEARKHYIKNLTRKHFDIWCSYWYDMSRGWRFLMRADIHYNLKIQQRYFESWRVCYNQRKSLLIKNKVAELYYEKNKRRIQIKLCFQKWKIFMNNRRIKKGRLNWAWNYFKSKHFPDILRPYFYRWKVLIKAARKEKKKLQRILKMYQSRLLAKYFRVLVNYRTLRRKKKHERNLIRQYYQRKLLFHGFVRWKEYLDEKLKYRASMFLAEASYVFKIKKFYFKKLHQNTLREICIKETIKAINLVIMRKAFKRWILFQRTRQIDKIKSELITNMMLNKLKLKALHKIRQYVEYKKEKRATEQKQLGEAVEHLKKTKLKFCFIKWRIYARHKKKQVVKSIEAYKFSQKTLLKKHVSYWKCFIKHKRYRKTLYSEVMKHYDTVLLKNYFQKLLQYLNEAKKVRKRVEYAKTVHRNNLKEEALKVIVLAGIRKKERLFKENVERVSRELFIAQKYLGIWKKNSIHRYKYEQQSDTFCETTCPSSGLFQMCFLVPSTFNCNFS